MPRLSDQAQGALPDLLEAGRTELEGLPLLRDDPDRTQAILTQRVEATQGRKSFQLFVIRFLFFVTFLFEERAQARFGRGASQQPQGTGSRVFIHAEA